MQRKLGLAVMCLLFSALTVHAALRALVICHVPEYRAEDGRVYLDMSITVPEVNGGQGDTFGVNVNATPGNLSTVAAGLTSLRNKVVSEVNAKGYQTSPGVPMTAITSADVFLSGCLD